MLMSEPINLGNKICKLCLDHFSSISKEKPETNAQWTVLASFVQQTSSQTKVVAVGTGTSCLGFNQTCSHGRLIHDSHAEIIAKRSFHRYLYGQLFTALNSNENSIFQLDKTAGSFELNPDVIFHFYSSQAPCGDASIYEVNEETTELSRVSKRKHCIDLPGPEAKRAKTVENELGNDINRTGAKCVPGGKQDSHGRMAEYHEIGLLRTKPGRGIPTHSMSCSDKLMKWNIMGCQGALMSSFLKQPIYISTFVTFEHGMSLSSLKRALIDRVPGKKLDLLLCDTPYKLNKPTIIGTSLCFKHCKLKVDDSSPCGSSVSWCDIGENTYSVTAKNGLRLGVTKKQQNSPKAVSCISRSKLFKSFQELNKLLKAKCVSRKSCLFLNCKTYSDFKNSLGYVQLWKKVQAELFPFWVAHDRSLDLFSV